MNRIRVFTTPIEPTEDTHNGMVFVNFEDVDDVFSEDEMYVFKFFTWEKLIKETEIIDPKIKILLGEHIVLDYEEKYFDVNYTFEINEEVISITKEEFLRRQL